jgi:hypothetical protein
MKKAFFLTGIIISLHMAAQDSTMNSLTNDMDKKEVVKVPVKIFSTERTINANTTETVGKGKMDFKVTHNFDDIDGAGGIFGRFLGLDNAKDVRIGFHIGVSKNLDVIVSRDKGAGSVNRLYELGFKYKLMDQIENDPSHPFAIAVFANAAVSSAKASSFPNFENSFRSFSDRLSQTLQLIIAKKIGKVSVQLNPTYVHTNYVILNDDDGIFAIGGAIRFPVTRNMNILIDYFHPFRSASSKKFFNTLDNTYNPPSDVTYNPVPFKFYDPLGIGFEILTAGHVFHLNFTNATEILENRFIPRTVSKWTKGQFRWGFTISRTFVLWRDKK